MGISSKQLLVFLGAATFIMTMNPANSASQPDANTQPANDAWRKEPPKAPPPRPFKLPNVTSYKLPNGLDVQLVEDHRVPFVTFNLGIKAGSTLEPHELQGLASMTSDLITEGTAKRTSKQIAEETDFIG